MRARWPGTSTGGKIIPAALQPRKRAGVLRALATVCQWELGLVRPLQQQHGRRRWESGCSASHWVPSPWLVPIFYETSETWRFSLDRPLLQGFGDDTYFTWKHNMMVFLLKLYIQDCRWMHLLHFSSQGVAWKTLLCSYRCWLRNRS